MSAVLLFVQHENGKVSKASLTALTAARELQKTWAKSGVHAIALGSGSRAAAEEALTFGLTGACFSEAALFEKYRSDPYARALVLAAKQCDSDVVVAAATSTGKDLLPRAAALLDAAQASDVIGIHADGTLRRPMFAGNVLADVELVGTARIVTVRTTAFAAAQAEGVVGTVSELDISGDSGLVENSAFGEVVGYEVSKADRPELTEAAVVISAGRAVGSKENFEKVIFPLADAFGAAVGASRAAVDSGYAPNDWQVGQTGKVVAPSLYIAIGISGAVQHLAGMKDSKVIVAINKDGDAPIFEIADYGLVGDLFEIIPKLTDAVKKVRG